VTPGGSAYRPSHIRVASTRERHRTARPRVAGSRQRRRPECGCRRAGTV